MIRRLLDVEGPLICFLEKTGQLILLSVLWLFCSLPVITLVPATAAFYYSVVKSVRFGFGNPLREFFASLRTSMKRGLLLSVLTLLPSALLLFNVSYLRTSETGSALLPASYLLLVLLAMLGVYVGPALSRFRLGAVDIMKLAFVMSLRNIPVTLLALAAAVFGTLLQFYFLPIPTLLLLPGLICYLLTFPMEKALRRYMPPASEGEEAWYYR